MKTKYDLTNREELRSVIEYLRFSSPLLIIFDKIFSTDTTKAQQEAAESLIKKGKENGVDEMKITVDNAGGFKLNVPMDDVKIDTMLGADEKMHIIVKYK